MAVLMLVGCAAGQPPAQRDRGVQRELLPDRGNTGKRIEVYWTKPTGQGPWPAFLFIHGHQGQVRNGGESYVKTGRLDAMAGRGYVAAALSQPGYGNSDGPADFCGPLTQEAARVALEFLRNQSFVDPNKVVLYGYSRGAIVAGMVATRDPKLAAVILGAGAYDFASWYPTPLAGIDANIRREAGVSAEAFRARSAMHHADRIRAPVLVLHGAQDERIPMQQAEAFADRLKAHGVAVQLKIFPAARHGIPFDAQFREIDPFLERSLR
jgi:dipeptidyl aminopeptidase/acylaminoacyl peptidase